MIELGDVDRGDGPAVNLPRRDYVAVTDPPAAGEQEAGAYLDRAIVAGTGIGLSYSRLDQSFTLGEHGSVLHTCVYKRTSPIKREDWKAY